MAWSQGLADAAEFHVLDQGPAGTDGHDSTDGTDAFSRIRRWGSYTGGKGENIAYGPNTGKDIVVQLIVDECVTSRGHRANIFRQSFGVLGTFTGPHSNYGKMATIDYAGAFTAKSEPDTNQPTQEIPEHTIEPNAFG